MYSLPVYLVSIRMVWNVVSACAVAHGSPPPTAGSPEPLCNHRSSSRTCLRRRIHVDGHDKPVPLRCVISPPWTVDTVHRADVSKSTARVVHRASPRAPRGCPVSGCGQHRVSHAHFAEKLLGFHGINPQSSPVQNKYNLVLFLFV